MIRFTRLHVSSCGRSVFWCFFWRSHQTRWFHSTRMVFLLQSIPGWSKSTFSQGWCFLWQHEVWALEVVTVHQSSIVRSECSDPCVGSVGSVVGFLDTKIPEFLQKVMGFRSETKRGQEQRVGNFWNDAKSNGIWIHRGIEMWKSAFHGWINTVEIGGSSVSFPCGSRVSRLVVKICWIWILDGFRFLESRDLML